MGWLTGIEAARLPGEIAGSHPNHPKEKTPSKNDEVFSSGVADGA